MRRRACGPPRLGQDSLLPATPEPDAGPAGEPAISRRIAALHLPWLPVERLCLTGFAAIWTTEGSRRALVAVSPAAAAAGLHPGQALADAQAILPELALHPHVPEADAAWLRRLAHWARCITPLPALDPPDGLLLDITGIAHLHGGEEALRRALVARFARAGVTVQAAIAGTADCAAGLARAGVGIVVPPGEAAIAVAPLPLQALRLPPASIAALHRLGLRRVGDLLRQPRGPLAKRFGLALLATLDAATGLRPRPLRPLRPPPDFLAARDFLEPVVTREAIDATLVVLLPELCRQLQEAGQGARRFLLHAFRVDGVVQLAVIGTGLPARDPRHIARLFREKLEGLEPGFGFERLALEARACAPLTAAQAALPGEGGASADTRRQSLAELLDRLTQRVEVWRLAPRASHWPERAIFRVGPFESVLPPPGWPGSGPRPVRLLRRPVRLSAVALLPDAPPSLLRLGRASWRVLRAEGPERIAPEWWRDRPGRPFRDYYRVQLVTGARLWVCRSGIAVPGEETQWWLHGRFE
ncbi:DNA polymerase Y family protein [Dankookia rubra]|uniref:DNA polymerase Y family protein n=1 Tax=Dankookia rubra TaxID=1442381 RepID=A0A4R5QGL6_9PROT|nr:DNA polymerase Y family protein [Dankookia rubra]TDH61878.1 DNA polymerase Y family protein [Dankookia rubra]